MKAGKRLGIAGGIALAFAAQGIDAEASWAARSVAELVSDADLVVLGTTRDGPAAPADGEIDLLNIAVEETLMGPTRGTIMLAVPTDRVESVTLRFEEGQRGIWILRRHEQAPDAYAAVHPSCFQPVERQDEVVREIAALRSRGVQFRLHGFAGVRMEPQVDLSLVFRADGTEDLRRRRVIPSLAFRMRNLSDEPWTFRTCEYIYLQNYISIEVEGPGGFRSTRETSLIEPMVVHEHRETRVEPWVWTDVSIGSLEHLFGREPGAYTLRLRLHRQDGTVIGEDTLIVNTV